MKVKASVTYEAILDIGDLPHSSVEKLLKEDDGNGNYNIWEQGNEVELVLVAIEEAK